jgi:hypothetical protein
VLLPASPQKRIAPAKPALEKWQVIPREPAKRALEERQFLGREVD